MENFATENQRELLKELNKYKNQEEGKINNKLGLTKQMIKENVIGIKKAINIIQKSLDDLIDM